jgi:hypothetical protein
MSPRAAIALLGALPSACVSDLAVGTSLAEISSNEAGAPAQEPDAGALDAGLPARPDASVDASRPVLDASLRDAAADASSEPDAAPDAAAASDAAVDAGRDAGSWRPCAQSECLIGFTTIFDGCGDAALQRCGRPSPQDACEWYCE